MSFLKLSICGVVCTAVVLAVWFGLQLGLGGILYASDTCDVPLDQWNLIGGIVGLCFAAVYLITGSMYVCELARPLFYLVTGLFVIFLLGWKIYGMTLLFQDDGLLCKLNDIGHDYSLWVFSLVYVLLGIVGLAGAGSAYGR